MPDTAGTANPFGYKLTNRYWSVIGDFPEGFDASGHVFYDGRGALDQQDHELFAQTSPSEDSLRLLYRPGPGHPWQEYATYFKNTLANLNDRYGFIRIDHLTPGEYTFAKGISTVSAGEAAQQVFAAKVSPNPARHLLHVQAAENFDKAFLYAADGSLTQAWSFQAVRETELNLNPCPVGSYWLVLTGTKGSATCTLTVVK